MIVNLQQDIGSLSQTHAMIVGKEFKSHGCQMVTVPFSEQTEWLLGPKVKVLVLCVKAEEKDHQCELAVPLQFGT